MRLKPVQGLLTGPDLRAMSTEVRFDRIYVPNRMMMGTTALHVLSVLVRLSFEGRLHYSTFPDSGSAVPLSPVVCALLNPPIAPSNRGLSAHGRTSTSATPPLSHSRNSMIATPPLTRNDTERCAPRTFDST
jgi:hypothetical protein